MIFDDLFGYTLKRTKHCHSCGTEEASLSILMSLVLTLPLTPTLSGHCPF